LFGVKTVEESTRYSMSFSVESERKKDLTLFIDWRDNDTGSHIRESIQEVHMKQIENVKQTSRHDMETLLFDLL